MGTRALVILSAVVAAAVARPGQLAAVQSPVADPTSSKAPSASTSSSQEGGVGGTGLVKGLQSAVPDSLVSSRHANPTTGIRFVDNPHIGLPFGAVLPLPDPVLPVRDVPTASMANPLNTLRRDSPHVGLPPPVISDLDSLLPLPDPVIPVRDVATASTANTFSTLRRDSPHVGLPPPIISDFDSLLPLPDPVLPVRDVATTSTANTLSTSRRDSPHIGLPPPIISDLDSLMPLPDPVLPVRDVPTGSTAESLRTLRRDSPHVGLPPPNIPDLDSSANSDRVNVNRGAASFGGQPKNQFANCFAPDVFKALFPNSRPIHVTRLLIPASSPMPHLTNNDGLHDRSGSASFPTINGNSNFLASNPNGGFFIKTTNSKFANISPLSFVSTSSPNNLFSNSPAKSPMSNPIIPIPINTKPFGYPIGSSNKPGNRLFSDNVPFGNIVPTAQGPVIVGGPFNLAIFPKQPSLDDINKVLAESAAAAASVVRTAGGPAFSPPADTTA